MKVVDDNGGWLSWKVAMNGYGGQWMVASDIGGWRRVAMDDGDGWQW